MTILLTPEVMEENIFRRAANVAMMVISFAAAATHLAIAQLPPTATLTIDIGNVVEYQEDISDPGRFARNPGITPSAGFANFGVVTLLGDIVAVQFRRAARPKLSNPQVALLHTGRADPAALASPPTPAFSSAVRECIYRNPSTTQCSKSCEHATPADGCEFFGE